MGNIINRFSNPDKGSSRGDTSSYYVSIPTSSDSIPPDINSPLVFSDWLKHQNSVDPNNQHALYLQYVISWYNNSISSDITGTTLHDSYIDMLQSLALVFKDSIRDEWVRDLSFTNDIDIHDSIEFYSRKLKEIAIYLINKRNDAKVAKLKYNLTGSGRGIQNLFEDYILKAFTQRNYVLNIPTQDVYDNLPALSAISDDARIIIEPYYDTTHYFDKSPNVDVNTYFTPDNNEEYLSALGIDSIDLDDLYQFGILDNVYESEVETTPVPATVPLSGISDSVNQARLIDILSLITRKFTSTIKHRLQIYETLDNVITATYVLPAGNSWFYWPSGEYIYEQDPLDITSIALNSTNLYINGATAGETYEDSDKIFVTTNDVVEGAWLKRTPSTSYTDTMSASIDPNSRFLFKFPYPGYGTAAATLDWTGPALSNIDTIYNYTDAATQRYIENVYFNDSRALTGINITPININNTSLARSNATAGSTYITADKVTRRLSTNEDNIHDSTPDLVYTDSFNHSWLYDLTHTNLVLPPGQTKVLWPYLVYEETPSLSFAPSGDVCISINLTSVMPGSGIVGATAGAGLYDSDIFYTLDGVNATASSCAYLKGTALSAVSLPITKFTNGIKGTYQPGLYLKCIPGHQSTFLWSGTDNLSLSSTNIKYHAPGADSDYLTRTHTSIYSDRLLSLDEIQSKSSDTRSKSFGVFGVGGGVGNWKTEQYRTPIYSPIGHTGTTYDEFGGMADIIVLDWQHPEPFSIDSWTDDQGRDYTTSPDFAWFQLSANPTHPDVGFGPGQWVNYSGAANTFKLKAGYQYKYLRNSLSRTNTEITSNAVPYLIIKEEYDYNPIFFQWTKCVIQQDGTWTETVSASPITIAPGSIILYDHADTTTYCITSEDTRGTQTTVYNTPGTVASRTDSRRNYITYTSAPTGTVIGANWPVTVSVDSTIPTQVEVDTITWSVTAPSTSVRRWASIDSGTPISFEMTNTGVYTLCALAVKTAAAGGGRYDTGVMPITAFANTLVTIASGSLVYNTINIENIDIDARVPLNGWDSTTSRYTGANTGRAKPFWAKAYDDVSDNTKNKATSIYGTNLGFFGEYTPRTQPTIDDWDLDVGNVIEVHHIGDEQIVWVEDIEFEEDNEEIEWKALTLSEDVHPLQTFISTSITQLVVSATDVTSDIILSPYTQTCTDKVFINYHAQSGFTWTQPLTTIFSQSIAIINSSIDVQPIAPYAYLTNRHYPTMAVVPDITNIVLAKNLGIFKPSNLGMGGFFTKSHTQSLTTTYGSFNTYADINERETDYGFTQETNTSVVDYIQYDAQWMKHGITTIARSGEIKNPGRYQKFIPYANSAEHKISDNTTINNETDPWTGVFDDTWRDSIVLPPDFRGQDKIETWYNNNISPSNTIYQYCDDVYGTKYYLFKDVAGINLYDQRDVNGALWIKTGDNVFGPATVLLASVFDNYIGRSYYNDLINGEIKNIYCFADILVIVLDDVVLIERIQFDYTTGTLFSIVDDSQTISLSNKLFGDVLCILSDKNIYITITDTSTCFKIYKVNIDTRVLDVVFPKPKSQNISLLALITAIPNVSYDTPMLSYNKSSDLYNVSFFANVSSVSAAISAQYLISVNMNENYSYFNVKNVDIVTPNV